MKYFKPLLTLLAAAVVFLACKKEYSVENGTGTNALTAQWEFKEGGVQFKGPIDTAYVDTVSGIRFLTVNGKSDDGKDQLILQVFTPDLKPGTYKTPLSSFDYLRNGASLYQSDLAAVDSFSLTITQIDAVSVTGTFTGKAKDKAGASRTIVDGKFSAKFKTGSVINPPVKDSGQVMLWSKSGCGGGTSTSPISVSIAGKNGQITKFNATEPTACGSDGAFTVKLAVGSYNWTAKCGTDSVTGSVTVTNGGCTKVEVNFAAAQLDYFPITANSNWSYLYQGSTADDTLYTFSTGTIKTFGTASYSIFTNTDGVSKDSSYYKKGGGTYYEYYPADANVFGLDNPTAVEYIFLKDNVPVNSIWNTQVSGTITDTTTGIPITVNGNIQGKILEKGVAATVSGITYPDVIKVQLSFQFIAGSITQEVYRVEQWFARGKGLIKYIDFVGPDFTQPTDVLNATHTQIF